MGATPTDHTTLDTLAAHLSRQDGELRALREIMEESIADRKVLHGLHDGHEQRIAGVEGRVTVLEGHRARVDRAIAVQLKFSDWWEKHKVRINIVAIATAAAIPVISACVQALFRHWGWL